MQFTFSDKKKIQAAAIILHEEGGRADLVRMLKLLYIADRESWKERGLPILGGRMSALDHGPLHSDVYNMTKDDHPAAAEWDRFFGRQGYKIVLENDPGRLELSPYEVEKLQEVVMRYLKVGTWQLVEITHKFPEWLQNYMPNTSRPISVGELLAGMDVPPEEIELILKESSTFAQASLALGA